MTGYSAGRSDEPEFSIAVSIKSINHRFLDLQIKLPAGLDPVEPALRRLIREHVTRGHVEFVVNVERAGASHLQLNRKLLDAYMAAYDEMRKTYGFTSDPDLVALLRVPGVVGGANGGFSSEELARLQPALERLAVQILDGLNQMRVQEGAALERDVRSRLSRLREFLSAIECLAGRVPELCRRRLEKRILELAEGAELDAGRLSQEVVYLASRSDIAEEVTRFRSHLDQTDSLLDGAVEAGKKLDFLLQEMNREANTMLAKTTDVPEIGPELARQAIDVRTEVEKLREQAQNIE